MNAPALPESTVLADIAQVIGREAAWRLVEALGGLRIFVPNEVPPDHEIAQAIGAEAAAKLADHYHGTRIVLPGTGKHGRRARRVKELARKTSMTRKKIAAATGYSERHVYNILRPEDDPGEADLFGRPTG